jgi:hypothetical protein
LLAATGGLAVFAALLLRRVRRLTPPSVLLAFLVLFYLQAALWLLPAVNPYKSHRAMCEAILRHVGPDQPLRGFFDWKWRASYSFYTGRSIPRLASLDELRRFWESPGPVFVLVERGSLDEARVVLGAIPPLEWREIGGNAAYLFSNRQPVGDEEAL